MIKGIEMEMGGEKFVIPALTLGQLRSGAFDLMKEHDQLVTDGKTLEALGLRAKVILLAVKRNYPEMNEAAMDNLLDMENNLRIWRAVLGQSGIGLGE